jgi:hypothetical protein
VYISGLLQGAWDRAGFKGKSLEKTITDVLGGDLEDACLCLITHPLDAICGKLKEVMIAPGLYDDSMLC